MSSASSARSAAITGTIASIAFSPLAASPAWAGRPATRTENHSTPTCAFQIAPPVGSVMTAASARLPASTHAAAPLPVHSSSTTDCSSTGPRGANPSRRRPATAPTIAARPAFMSPAPRPYIHSPSRRGSNGSEDHSADGSGLTTSMWPLRISDRPRAAGPASVAVTLALPSTSQLNGDAAGLARRAAASSGTSTGSRPRPENARRMTSWPAASAPSSVRARTRSSSSASISARPAATASRTAPSSGRAAPIDEGLGVGPGGEVRERLAPREARPAVLDAPLGREVRRRVDGAEAVRVARVVQGRARGSRRRTRRGRGRGRRPGRAGSARARRCGSRARTPATRPGPGGSSSPGSG